MIGQVKPEGRPLLEGEEDNFGSSSSSSSSSSTTSKEDTGPLKEMTKNNFDLLCPMKNRLCTILLVDGSQKEQTKEVIASVEIAKQKESGMLSWSWMDGICHSKLTTLLLGESIDLASTLPTVVVISRCVCLFFFLFCLLLRVCCPFDKSLTKFLLVLSL